MMVSDASPSAVIARGAYIDALPVAELFVDRTYQRELDVARVRKFCDSWDRRLAGVLEVSDRGPGHSPRFAVIDGQHRWAAAKARDESDVVVVSIHEGLSVADEARLFDRINRERRQPSTWDHWRARQSAGDQTVQAISGVVTGLGLQIDPAPRDGNVRCTATLEKLTKLGGVELVGETLKLIVDVWDTRLEAFDAPVVHGLGLVLHHLRDQLDEERLADSLLGVVPRQLKSQASALRDTTTGTAPKLMAIAIMLCYNRNRRISGPRIMVNARTFGGGSRNARSLPARSGHVLPESESA